MNSPNFVHAVLALLLLICQTEATHATSGQRASEQNSIGLSKRLSLALDDSSLEEVLAAVSQSTGEKVVATPAIAKRRLIFCVNQQTLKQALDSLCDLYGWEWYRKESGEYCVTRARPGTPRNIEDILRIASNALPIDLREIVKKNNTIIDSRYNLNPSCYPFRAGI